jgi:hypothetical protein
MNTDVKLSQEQFGEKNETDFFNILKQNGIVNIVRTEKYTQYDYYFKLNNMNIYIELKTRCIKKEAFDTTILAVNKINFFNNDIYKQNKIFYAIFGYMTDTKEMEYYYIKYDKDLFSTYNDKKRIYGKYHYEIPITDLTEISKLYDELGT